MENVYNNDNMIVGLDIGTTKIATVIGYRNENGQIDIIGYGKSESTGVEFGEIRNINKTVTGITLSTSMASQRSNQEIKSVYVGIAGHHIKTSRYNHHLFRQGKKTPITSEEIENLKNEVFHATVPPGEEIIDVIPQKYLIDKERVTFEPVGELGNEVIGTYQLITGKISEIDRIKMCGEESGIHLNDIILEPIASGMACLTEEEKRHGVALVDIGGGTSDLIIFVDGNPVYTKVIAMGGNVITRDIAQVCKISEDVAEKLKISYGTCIVEKSHSNNLITIPKPHGQEPIQINENYLAQIINSRVQGEILSAIQKEIDNSGYKDRLFAGLVLTGGGSNLRHIKELCQYMLQMPTRIGIPDNGFAHSIPTELKQPAFSTALGLLKYGIETEENLHLTTSERGTIPIHNPGPDSDPKPDGASRWGLFKKVHDYLKEMLENVS